MFGIKEIPKGLKIGTYPKLFSGSISVGGGKPMIWPLLGKNCPRLTWKIRGMGEKEAVAPTPAKPPPPEKPEAPPPPPTAPPTPVPLMLGRAIAMVGRPGVARYPVETPKPT
jgi:hypothetical protein